MPVVLEESQFEDWMRGPPELAAVMMRPYGGAIDIWEVDKDVGNVRNNKPELLNRVALLSSRSVRLVGGRKADALLLTRGTGRHAVGSRECPPDHVLG